MTKKKMCAIVIHAVLRAIKFLYLLTLPMEGKKKQLIGSPLTLGGRNKHNIETIICHKSAYEEK